MRSPIGLAFVLVLGGCASCFADSEWLRISVECPHSPGSGVLVTVDEKPSGHRSRVSTFYTKGQVDSITVSNSQDGSHFNDRFTLGRTDTKERPAFRAFEDRANELIRFFCLADPEAKQRYLDLLQANRELLRQEKGK